MAPTQATLGEFFGRGSQRAPTQQTKLAFTTKPTPTEGKKQEEDEDEARSSLDTIYEGASERDTKKRSRMAPAAVSNNTTSKSKFASIEDEEHHDCEEPPVKKARRNRKTIQEDEDDEVMPDVKEEAIASDQDTKSAKRPHSNLGKKKNKESTSKRVMNENTKMAKIAECGKAAGKEEDGYESDKEVSALESASEVEDEIDEEEEEKPAVAAKVRKTVQKTLMQLSGKDPYPDWKPGEPVPYAALCATFSLVELTTKRLIIMEHCSRFLRQVLKLTPEDMLPTVLLMINKLAADYAGIELGIGESLIMKAIGESTGRSLAIIKQDQREIGDLGLVAVKSRSTQPTMFKPKQLTVRGVFNGLTNIATVTGNGAQGRKVDMIKKLLSAADVSNAGKVDINKDKGGPSEAKFIVRFLEGKLRLGLAERTVLPSLAQAVIAHEASQKETVPRPGDVEKAEQVLKTVYSELPSYEVIIPALLEHGIMNLKDNCKLRPGIPLKPMLAKPTKAITEVLDRFENQTFTCEYKYDGERAQIHYVAKKSDEKLSKALPGANKAVGSGLAAIFSRNSEDLSQKYPDILAKLDTWVKPDTKSFVLDCETVAWDVREKKVLPFQQLMTRKKKDVKIEDVKIKVCVFAFDLLYLNGEAVVERPLRERRTMLEASFNPIEGEFAFATHMNGQELDEIQTFLDESVKASCEGLMVKMLDGAESGYEPSKRSRNWLKIKKDYLSGIGDSLDLVVLGAYYGKGKRTSVYGAFLLACYNPSNDKYETVCNIGTGFSDAVLEELHTQLSDIVIDRPKPFYSHSSGSQHQPDVWFEPRFVWEVKTADLTLSPRYKAGCGEGVDPSGTKGISLRFPRFIKLRDDKKPDQATSSRQVAEMYRKQESVTKNKGPAVDDDFEY